MPSFDAPGDAPGDDAVGEFVSACDDSAARGDSATPLIHGAGVENTPVVAPGSRFRAGGVQLTAGWTLDLGIDLRGCPGEQIAAVWRQRQLETELAQAGEATRLGR